MRNLVVACAAIGSLLLPSGSGAQVAVLSDGPIELAVTGRLQTQFNTSSVADVDAYSMFEQRRARVGVDLLIDRWIEGRMEWNFAHGARLEDGWVNLALDRAFQVQVGQFKKPFSRLELTSSSQIVPIEYGLRIRGLGNAALYSEHYLLLQENGHVGRDIGGQIHGTLGPLRYAAGVFNGSGQNARDDNDAKSYAARLNLRPFAAPFEIGGGASYRDVSVLDSLGMDTTQMALAVGFDLAWGGFRHPGPSLLAEVMQAKNFRTDDPMIGGQAIVSWFAPLRAGRVEGIEPLIRGSYGDPSIDFAGNSGILLTPGVNLYFHGRNRLMLNWDYFRPELDTVDVEHAIRAQLQLFF